MSRLKGLRTHLVSAAFFLVGMADLLHDLDVKQALTDIGVPGDKIGVVMVAMAIIFAGLRMITTTPQGVPTTTEATN
jgi:hypothetical protein